MLFYLLAAVLGAKEVTQHVVQEGSTFNLTCVTGQQHANVTWTLPTAVLNSTYFQNVFAFLYIVWNTPYIFNCVNDWFCS